MVLCQCDNTDILYCNTLFFFSFFPFRNKENYFRIVFFFSENVREALPEMERSLIWFGRFGLVGLAWFGRFGLAWFGRFGYVSLVW